ncbi:major capsid protein [Nocardioides sp. SLBN-35]|uniref:major capsid protein n=1 Tax=Nocardioides sp. SLBN-35 TaxID=2768445 RepID=UPI00114F3148|nr:major capsid protein [Nocardioides sp. SLBN-35]TQK73369.1 major capsid protein E [Nocardioides sp. SLBN-35]
MQIIDLVPDLRPTILAARELRDARNSLARFLPYANVPAITYRLGRRKRLDQTVAVRAFGAPAVPIRRPGVVDVRGELPAITPIVNLNEVDLNNELVLAQQLAGLQVDWQPALTSAAAAVALTVDNTLEVMRGQVLSTGIVSLIAEDGDVHSVDFGIPAEQKITAAAPWDITDPAAVFADYAAAHEAYMDVAGDRAGVALTSEGLITILTSALQVLYPQQPVGTDQLSAYLTNRRLPVPVAYDRKLEDATGARTRVFPEGTITFLPGADDPVGRTEMGITQEAVQQSSRQQPNGQTALRAAEVPGMTIVTLGNEDPVERAVKAAAVGLPVLQDRDIVILSGLVAP